MFPSKVGTVFQEHFYVSAGKETTNVIDNDSDNVWIRRWCTLNNSPAGYSAKHYLFHIKLFQILESTFATSFFHDCQLFLPHFQTKHYEYWREGKQRFDHCKNIKNKKKGNWNIWFMIYMIYDTYCIWFLTNISSWYPFALKRYICFQHNIFVQ